MLYTKLAPWEAVALRASHWVTDTLPLVASGERVAEPCLPREQCFMHPLGFPGVGRECPPCLALPSETRAARLWTPAHPTSSHSSPLIPPASLQGPRDQDKPDRQGPAPVRREASRHGSSKKYRRWGRPEEDIKLHQQI